jgi:hypothetical protein
MKRVLLAPAKTFADIKLALEIYILGAEKLQGKVA